VATIGHSTTAVRHHVLARIDPNKYISLGLAARQPSAGPVGQPLAGDLEHTPAKGWPTWPAVGWPAAYPKQTNLSGVYSG